MDDEAAKAADVFLLGPNSATVSIRDALAAAFRVYGEAQRRAGAEETRAAVVAWLRNFGEAGAYALVTRQDNLVIPPTGVSLLADAIESHADERGETEEKCGRCNGIGEEAAGYFGDGMVRTRACPDCGGTGQARKP